MDTLSTNHLHEIVQRKLLLLQTIKQMTLQQTALVAAQDVDQLLAHLSHKNDAMEALQKVQAELKPFNVQEPAERRWESEAKRLACKAELAQCDQIIRDLLVLESQAIEQLKDERTLISAHLQQIHDSASVERAYEANSESVDYASLSLEG